MDTRDARTSQVQLSVEDGILEGARGLDDVEGEFRHSSGVPLVVVCLAVLFEDY